MKLRAFTNLLIFIYGLSTTGFGIMEVAHEITHTFKNNIHHHESNHHHGLEDHDLQFQVDHSNSTDENIIFLLSFSFLFYEFYTLPLIDLASELKSCSLDDSKLYLVDLSPLIPASPRRTILTCLGPSYPWLGMKSVRGTTGLVSTGNSMPNFFNNFNSLLLRY